MVLVTEAGWQLPLLSSLSGSLVNAIWGSILFGGLYILYLYIPGLDRGAQEIFKALPYVVTIIVLVFTSLRKEEGISAAGKSGTGIFP